MLLMVLALAKSLTLFLTHAQTEFWDLLCQVKKSWNIFKSSDDIFIPCQDICKIGEDVILVRVMIANTQVKSQKVKASKQIWQNPPQNANISATSKTLESNSQNETQTQSTLGSTTQTNDNFLATLGNGFENGNDG